MDSRPTVAELTIALKHVTKTWKTFAVHLRSIEAHHYEEIEINCNTLADYKIALFNKWLQVCSDATWSDVVTALKAIDEHALADKITAQFTTHKTTHKKIHNTLNSHTQQQSNLQL